jgi:hypothetical protein
MDSPAIVKTDESSDGSVQIRSALQVDEIENPKEAAASILDKVEKVELLRHYRIADFENIE